MAIMVIIKDIYEAKYIYISIAFLIMAIILLFRFFHLRNLQEKHVFGAVYVYLKSKKHNDN
jgi:HKD family nuclease